jgi:hypothetical protein
MTEKREALPQPGPLFHLADQEWAHFKALASKALEDLLASYHNTSALTGFVFPQLEAILQMAQRAIALEADRACLTAWLFVRERREAQELSGGES